MVMSEIDDLEGKEEVVAGPVRSGGSSVAFDRIGVADNSPCGRNCTSVRAALLSM